MAWSDPAVAQWVAEYPKWYAYVLGAAGAGLVLLLGKIAQARQEKAAQHKEQSA